MANDTIDTRVVQMEFDNRQFEKNIKQTSKSLDNLKQSLDFKGVGDSVDEVRLRISALQIAATTFIANIANKITNLGIMFVKSLSVDNISAGWSKFGEKTTSIATMMAQKIRIAGQEITDLSERTSIVNEQMELLTWFSDETSYSFTDMVNNVSKFTAAGQDLDKSVKAMEGIATWAAASGQNAQTASVAMYQLAQAMSAGTVKLQDWKSIQNANMDTEEFRDKILETAVAMGQLTKEGDQFVTKTGKKFTKAQFTTQLSEGWFTSDVLIEGLNKYSAAIDEIYEISKREGITASEVIEKYGDTLNQFGVKAFKSAQEARTFTDVLNSVKDAVSSKWMTTFENIFGNQQEAVRLWTDLANELYDVFAESGNFRNDILSVWKELGGHNDLFAKGGDNQGAFWNIYDAIIAVRDIIKSAWETIFPLSEMESMSDQAEDIGKRLKGITERVKNFTSILKTSSALTIRLSKILQTIFSVIKMTINGIKILRYVLDPVVVLIKELTNQILDKLAFLGNKVSSSVSLIENVVVKLHDILEGIINEIALPEFLEDIFSTITNVFKIISDVKPLSKILEFVQTFIKSFKDSIKQGGILENIIKLLKSAFSILFEVIKGASKVLSVILPIIFNILNSIGKLAGSLSGTFANAMVSIINFIEALFNFIKESGLIENIISFLETNINRLSKSLAPILNFILKIAKGLIVVVQKTIGVMSSIFEGITKNISGNKVLNTLDDLLGGLIRILTDFLGGIFKLDGTSESGIFEAIKSLFSGILEVVKATIPILTILVNETGKLLQSLGKLVGAIVSAVTNALTNKDNGSFTSFVIRLGLLLLTMLTIYKLLTSIGNTLLNINWILESIQELAFGAVRYLKASTFKEIGKALLYASSAIVLIAQVDDKAMIDALATVIILAGIMIGIVSLINNMAMSMKMYSIIKMLKLLGTFQSIAFALVISSAAIYNIAKLDVKSQDKALKTILILLGSFVLIIEYLNGFSSSSKAQAGANVITSLSWSLLMMSFSLRMLSSQPWLGIASATGSLITTLFAFSLVTEYLSKKTGKNSDKAKVAIKLMNAMAASMFVMALSLRMLTSQPWQGILAGTGAILSVLIAFTFISTYLSKKTGKNSDKAKVAIKLMNAMAASMFVMALSLRMLTSQPWQGILAGTGAILSVLIAFTFISTYLSKKTGKNSYKAKVAIKLMNAMAASMFVMALSLRMLTSQPWQGILAGTGAILSVLIAFTFISTYLSKKTGKNAKKTINAMYMLASISLSMLAFGMALKNISGIPWKNILVSVGVMMASIVGIVSMVMILNKVAGTMDISITFFKLAASMLVLGITLNTLASGFRSFNNVDFTSIFKGLISFAGSLLILGTISKIVEGTTIGVIFRIASSLALVGISLLAAGIGLTYFGSGLMKMADIIGPLLELLTIQITNLTIQVTEGLIAALPRIIEALGPMLDSVKELRPKITELTMSVIEGILEILDKEGPHIIETVITLLDSLLKTLNDHMYSISDNLLGILKTILRRIASNIEELGQSLVDIMVGLINTLNKNIDPLTKALIDFLIKATIALFEHIGPLIDIVTDYVFDFIARVTVSLTGKLVALAGMITKVVLIVLAAVIRLTIASLGALNKLFLTFVSSVLLIMMHTFIGLTNVLLEIFKVIVKESLKVLVEAIIWAQDAFVAIGKMIINFILRGVVTAFLSMAGWLLDLIDLIFGTNIRSSVQEAADALANDARNIVEGISAGTDQVFKAINNASNNINDVISYTADSANEAVLSGMSQISDVVTDSMDQLGDAMTQFGEEAGSNLYTGIGSSENINGANQVGQDMGNAAAEGFSNATETHSPSRLFARFGNFLMQGLGLGIQNGASETENIMSEVIGDSLQLATDILDGREGDDYTIKVGMDISSVEAQTSRIQDIMSGVNNPSITASGRNAGYNARALERNNRGSETVNNDNSTTVTYNNTFNIESTDPQQSADEIDKVLKEQNIRFKLAHGT